MFDRLVTRQIAALIVALGVFLSGAAPAWARAVIPRDGSMSSGLAMMMPGMDMQKSCVSDKETSGKQAPCKGSDNSCAVCVGCAVNAGLTPNFLPATLLDHSDAGAFAADAKLDGLTTAPALPPPISRA